MNDEMNDRTSDATNREGHKLRAWLDEHEPSSHQQHRAAAEAWEGDRKRRRAWPWIAVAALAAGVLIAWIAVPRSSPRQPRYDASLVVHAGGQDVRIEVGVRENEQ